ncbi:MAG: IMPACT family protein [Flavobacteriales bacterium]
MSTFKSIAAISEGFYKEKGSKFYAFAVPCQTEEEVKAFIQAKRKEHHQAVHVCSAFRLGSDKKKYRSSDDGEPSNSAGPPILGQIQSYDLTNILVAVVRYYGGTNLGVGGLITAYRTAAKEALDQAEIIECEEEVRWELQFTYAELPQVMKSLKAYPCTIISQELSEIAHIVVSIPLSQERLMSELQDVRINP